MSRMPRRPIALIALLLVAIPGTALARPDRPASPTSGGDRSADPRVTVGSGTTQWVFSTRDRQFLPHTSNQGWWSNVHRATNSNDNYLTGRCCGGGEYRNFFTFHLTGLTGTVTSATLVLRKYEGRGGPFEKLRLYDVKTPAWRLNHNHGRDLPIFRDLGRGIKYGTYRLSTADETSRDDVFKLRLNLYAVADISRARGEFFSLGGHILTLRDGGFLFSGSGGRGRQELVVTTMP
jgi:hypothetical protein